MTSRQKADMRQQPRRQKALSSINEYVIDSDLLNSEGEVIDFKD